MRNRPKTESGDRDRGIGNNGGGPVSTSASRASGTKRMQDNIPGAGMNMREPDLGQGVT